MSALALGPVRWSLLVAASRPAVDRRLLLVPLAGALVAPVVAWSVLDDPVGASAVLRLVALLLAVAVAAAVDEPRDLLVALPTGAARRLSARLLVVARPVAPVWVFALALAAGRGSGAVAAGLTVELLALAAVGVAVGAGLRRWRDVAQPAVLVGPVLAGLLLGAGRLPQRWALLAPSPDLPGWGAAHGRWGVLLVTALAATALAYRRV